MKEIVIIKLPLMDKKGLCNTSRLWNLIHSNIEIRSPLVVPILFVTWKRKGYWRLNYVR